jgi:hypothetical protein
MDHVAWISSGRRSPGALQPPGAGSRRQYQRIASRRRLHRYGAAEAGVWITARLSRLATRGSPSRERITGPGAPTHGKARRLPGVRRLTDRIHKERTARLPAWGRIRGEGVGHPLVHAPGEVPDAEGRNVIGISPRNRAPSRRLVHRTAARVLKYDHLLRFIDGPAHSEERHRASITDATPGVGCLVGEVAGRVLLFPSAWPTLIPIAVLPMNSTD